MTTLENDLLRISINPKGAELTTIFHKPTGIEHLWQADPSVWGWHAPNLFPVVGGCMNNQLLVNGKTYPMDRHGFARHSLFDTTESSATHAIFSLHSNDATYSHFPFTFVFQIVYELFGSHLNVTYRVVNEGKNTLFFSVGAHPAFAVPFYVNETYEDYFLEFEIEEPFDTHMLSPAGYFTGETKIVPTAGNRIPLSKSLFDQDALVFKNLISKQVTIRSYLHNHSIKVNFPDFSYLGIWAKPGASFVCIEPWLGCADSEGPLKPIDQKEAIQHIGEGNVFSASFSIVIA